MDYKPAGGASAKTLTTVIYALYAASFFVGITAIVAIVMNYVKKDDVAGTMQESHFRGQIRTFWFGRTFESCQARQNPHLFWLSSICPPADPCPRRRSLCPSLLT